MKLEDMDFDNLDQVQARQNEVVEIPVGVLFVLLENYYTGGGQPDGLGERLKEAIELAKS